MSGELRPILPALGPISKDSLPPNPPPQKWPDLSGRPAATYDATQRQQRLHLRREPRRRTALIARLLTIAWSRYQRSYEKAVVATMISDPRKTATAQELYHRLHLTYAPDIDLFEISPVREARSTSIKPEVGPAGPRIERAPERCEI